MDSRFRGNDTDNPMGVHQDAAGVWGVCNTGLMNQAPTRLRFTRATRRGVQRGKAPLRYFYPPRVGGRLRPRPRQCGRTLPGIGVFPSLGTNHPEEGAGTSPCRGFGGVPQLPSVVSPKIGGRGLTQAQTTAVRQNAARIWGVLRPQNESF
jgi:hypothetical protein